MKKPRPRLPIRLNAKPTKPHSTKRGARGYTRARAKAALRQDLRRTEDGARENRAGE